MIFLIALRNIIQNKKNSIIVISLIALVTSIFFIGNSVIISSNTGLSDAYINSSTSDIIIEKKTDVTMSLYGANVPIIDNYFTIEPLKAYSAVIEALENIKGIKSITSQVTGAAYLDVMDIREAVLLCGVDARTYFLQLPGIKLEEGNFLAANEYGAMITKERALKIEKEKGQKIQIGTPLLFTSAGDAGFKIREVPLVGIFSYKTKVRFMDEIVIADAQTVRVLSQIQVASSDVEVEDDALKLIEHSLESLNIDDIFNEDIFNEDYSSIYEIKNDKNDDDNNIDDIGNIDNIDDNDFSKGEWNFILVSLESGINKSAMLKKINSVVSQYGDAAYNWRIAAGTSAILVLLLQMLFNTGVMLVSIAGVVAIINIFLISVFKRTREIGTLRSLGAGDSYIRVLIISENIFFAIAAGVIGIILGYTVLLFVNKLQLHIGNELLANLFGGSILHIDFVPSVAFSSVLLSFLLSIAASIYPTEMAVKIDPIVALRQG
ncbi:MAG: hypothetical protein Ta2G_11860 [Termitinemataceae bacterium]|nr:MAG: hypothetical protein Ta2G_11860 [Termitinemataceae bacterium]